MAKGGVSPETIEEIRAEYATLLKEEDRLHNQRVSDLRGRLERYESYTRELERSVPPLFTTVRHDAETRFGTGLVQLEKSSLFLTYFTYIDTHLNRMVSLTPTEKLMFLAFADYSVE